MKQAILLAALIFSLGYTTSAQAPARVVYEYKQLSTIESVVPGGLGRSRMVSTDNRGQTLEKDLKNFYSLTGINFDNVVNNDGVIVERLNELSNEGWELYSVTTGSNMQISNGSTSGGLFITRYLFRRAKG